jgi:hypothetical protein
MKKNKKTNDIKEKFKNEKKLDDISSYDHIPKSKPWIRNIYRRIYVFEQNVKTEEW